MKRILFAGCVIFATFNVFAARCVTAIAHDGTGADKKTIVVFAT
jgi:hypothetical protein